MTITINNAAGPCGMCRTQLPDLFPVGYTLNVRYQLKSGEVMILPISGRK